VYYKTFFVPSNRDQSAHLDGGISDIFCVSEVIR